MSRRKLPCLESSFPHAVAVLALLAVAAGAQTSALAAKPPAHPTKAVRAVQFEAQAARWPLTFEANRGQTDARAQFLARSRGSVIFLTAAGAMVKTTAGAVGMNFVGATPQNHPQGLEAAPLRVNYFIAHKAAVGVPSYRQVRYAGIYPGVDLVYYGHQDRLEYDLQVAPHADASRIRLAVAGARPSLTADGSLHLTSGLALQAPQAYQIVAGHRRTVAVRYQIRPDHTIGFQLGAYNPSTKLVIDPVLYFSTLLGGSQYNQANAVAIDSSGAGYVAGYTLSSDFPTVAPIQGTLAPGTNGPDFDAFISKISADGTALVYSTYLGGNGDDEATGIAVDSTGAAYVAGFTSSTNFPTAVPYQASNASTSGYNAFVAKLNPAGTALVYSTYLGGSDADKAAAIAVDGVGNAYIAGLTASSNFPITSGAPQSTFTGTQDAFVTSLNPSGSALNYSTYLGGSAAAQANAIAVDQVGNAYVGGETSSSDFPVSAGALQTVFGGEDDGFITKVDRSGRSLDYSTYLGGSRLDEVNGIAVDTAQNAFVTGDTNSINIFPNSTSAYQTGFAGGSSDAFVAELNHAGSALDYGTYLGGSQTDVGTAIAVDNQDEAYVAGYTSSTTNSTNTFPVTSSAAQGTPGGDQDAFLSKLDAVGQNLLYSTFLGGLDNDTATGIALNDISGANLGNLLVVGYTSSPNFPVTSGTFQVTQNSSTDAFITKYVSAAQGVFSPTTLGFAAQAPTVASTAESVIFTNGGELALNISSISTTGPYTETDNCTANNSTLQPGASCTLNVVFTPTAVGAQNGTLVIADNAPGGSQTLPLTGSGGNFTVTASPTTLTITAGASGSFSMNVTPAIGYTQVVTLSCTGIDATEQATCEPSPTTLTMNGSTTSTATMTVTTTVRPSSSSVPPLIPRGPWTWLALLGLGLAGAGLFYSLRFRAGARRLGWLGTALLLGWAVATVGCGGGSQNPGTAAGNYILTFTGTVGSVNQSVTNIQLTVD